MENSQQPSPFSRVGKESALLPGRTRRGWLAQRYRNTRKCVSSKAALLILTWSFLVGLLVNLVLILDSYIKILLFAGEIGNIIIILSCGIAAFLFCFFPLAGFLADIKCGRFKVVTRSLLLIVFSLMAFIFQPIAVICLYVGLIGSVQFGMDQLHDSVRGRQNSLHTLVHVDLLCQPNHSTASFQPCLFDDAVLLGRSCILQYKGPEGTYPALQGQLLLNHRTNQLPE